MNYVYLIEFTERKIRNEMPYYYVGSKSNADFVDGQIRSAGKEYLGSSSDKLFVSLTGAPHTTHILFESESYTEVLNAEKMFQLQMDVVADPRFFNKAIATINNYTNPDYATYKHITTGKCVRLLRNHPDVLSGVYVGVTKGTTFTPTEKLARGRAGEANAFFGRHHTDATKSMLSEKKKSAGETRSPETIARWIELVAKAPKSAEHRQKIGRKGLIMLKNIKTGQTIRIPKADQSQYDSEIWMNPIKAKHMITSRTQL